MIGPKTRLTPSPCPTCGKVMDAASGYKSAAKPSPGGLSVCAYCGEFLVFTEALSIRKMELAEEISLPDEALAQIRKVRMVVHLNNSRRGNHA